MYAPLLFAVASFVGGPQIATPPPTPVAVAAAPAPVAIATPAVEIAPVVTPAGHYTCTGEDNETADCQLDPEPVGRILTVAPGSDIPGQTLGSTDAAYGADLNGQLCAVKPEFC